MSTPPNFFATASKAARTSSALVTSQASASAFDRFGDGLRRRQIAIEHGHLRARARQRFRGGSPDARAAAGDDGHLPRQHLLGRLAELRLFQRPVFHVEHVGFGDRLIAADGFGIRDHFDRVLRDVGRDGGIFRRSAETEQSHARHEDDARQRIEFGLRRGQRGHCCARNSRDSARRTRRPPARRMFSTPSSFPASGAGTSSGQFLVRMV